MTYLTKQKLKELVDQMPDNGAIWLCDHECDSMDLMETDDIIVDKNGDLVVNPFYDMK